MKKGCELCKFHPDNVSVEDKKNKNWCTGILGMDGYYTWNTPLFVSDLDEWFQGESRIPDIKENGSVDCFQFKNIQNRPCTCGSGESWVNCSVSSQYCG